MEPTTFIGFIFAIALGGLIGAERELPWGGTKIGGASGFGGIRSYASISLLGAITVWLDTISGVHFWTVFGAIASTILIVVSYIYSSFHANRIGVTSEYAAFITYFIGVIAMLEHYTVAVILSILLLLLLSAKEYLSRLKVRFSREELGDSLKFAVISLVILPLLPDEKYSLLDMANWLYQGGLGWIHPILQADFFNPYGIWFFVVVMTGVEYAGFILAKTIGEKKGIIASGMIGGLISSTATTVAMTRKSVEHPEHGNSYVVATLFASCIMFIRVILIAAFIYPTLLSTVMFPASVMFIGLFGTALYYGYRAKGEARTIQPEEKKESYESPFQLIPALEFAGLIIIIKFVSKLGVIYQDLVPQAVSYYALGVFSGLADVDAISLTVAEGAKTGEIPAIIAATTMLVAVMSNNTIKASIAYRFGAKVFGKKVITAFGISILSGLVVIVGMNLFA